MGLVLALQLQRATSSSILRHKRKEVLNTFTEHHSTVHLSQRPENTQVMLQKTL